MALGANPYHYMDIAYFYGRLNMVKELLEIGAERGGMSPVHWAALNCHKEVLVYLFRDCKYSAGK